MFCLTSVANIQRNHVFVIKLLNAQDPDIFIQNVATTKEPESLAESTLLFGVFIREKKKKVYMSAVKLYFVFVLVLHKQYDSLNYST